MRNNLFIKPHWLWVLLPLAIAAILGSLRLNDTIFWSDEEYTIFMSAGGVHGPASFTEILARIGDQYWPPLSNLVLIPWAELTSWAEFPVRVFSWLAGLLAITVVYRMGADMFSRRVGLVAAVLLATSTFYLHYLYEGRGYTLYVLLSASTVYLYWRLLQHENSKPSWLLQIGFVLNASALIYTHYIAAATFGVLGIHFLFIMDREYTHRLRIFWLLVVVLLSYTPWLAVTILAVIARSNLNQGWDSFAVLLKMFDGFSNGMWPYLLLALLYAGAMVRTGAVRFVGFWLIMATALALIFNTITEFIFNIRHVLTVLPAIVLLIALALDDISRRVNRVAGVGLLALWIVVGMWHYAEPTDFNDRMEQVDKMAYAESYAAFDIAETCTADTDLLMFYMTRPEFEINTWQVLRYYFTGQPQPYTFLTAFDESRLVEVATGEQSTYDLDAVNDDAVWLFMDDALPQIEALTQVRSDFEQVYTVCYQMTDESGLSGWVYSQRDDLSCTVDGLQLVPCDAS